MDKANDLVILKVSGVYGTNLAIGSEAFPEIGEKIYAVGNPKGLNGTFSEGIISGVRDLQTSKVLQITAPVSPGSSGGPVLNTHGQVIGIAFASFTRAQNLNFAIPIKYLISLKAKMGTMTSISKVKAQPKNSSTTAINPNIKEGVSIRNIEICSHCIPTMIFFSIKNNLNYTVSDIKILFLVYDGTGTVVDYIEATYFASNPYEKDIGIKPLLAKSIDLFQGDPPQVTTFKTGYKVKVRVLDFKIQEE
jgi:hypothetical protein